ncbi:uncharacterized protein K02A2.6-like isoform X3 [Amphibalanus amphitrite]|nr:uncharacterized protein K02A2.6-like isoform X3 [Amphibalanus amphitrite]XP_043234040.1 uncharacterized protein K02A2.6-like isoform X3 [Amphibalanus amphitrite]
MTPLSRRKVGHFWRCCPKKGEKTAGEKPVASVQVLSVAVTSPTEDTRPYIQLKVAEVHRIRLVEVAAPVQQKQEADVHLSEPEDQDATGGGENTADALSRLPAPVTEAADDESITVAAVEAHLQAVTREELVSASRSDPQLQQLAEQIPRPWPTRYGDCPAALRPFYRFRGELGAVEDVLVRGERLLVPTSLRQRLLAAAHEGHQGIVLTKQRIKQHFWWPGLDAAVEEMVRACEVCASSDKTATPRNAPLHPVPLPEGPWEKVGIDFIGPMEGGGQRQRFAIVLVDYFSKWPEVGFCSSPSTEAAIEFLEVVASREGYPLQVVSDNGTAFVSAEFTAYLRRVGVQHVRVTPYHPRGAGAVERMNRVVKSALQTASKEKQDWSQAVRQFLRTYRSTPHATTGLSPSEMLHGRQLRTMLHAPTHPPGKVAADSARTRDRVAKRQRRQKVYWDRRNRSVKPSFSVGDWVRYRVMPVPRKGRDRFSAPHRIAELVGPSAYRLDSGALVHAERLTRWTGSPPTGLGDAEQPQLSDLPVVRSPPEPVDEPPAEATASAQTPERRPDRQPDVRGHHLRHSRWTQRRRRARRPVRRAAPGSRVLRVMGTARDLGDVFVHLCVGVRRCTFV